MMLKTLSISLFLMALLVPHGLASPAITKESLRSKLTPSMTLVFQSLHKAAAAIKDSQKERMISDSTPLNRWAGRQVGVVTDITKNKNVPMVAAPAKSLEDWSVVNSGGVFGDTESGRLPHILMMPIAPV